MQRITNVNKWSVIEDGKAMHFGNTEPRRVKIEVNAPDPVRLYYADGDGNITFLARVLGRDVVQFGADGEFSISADGADCWVYTVDGEDFSFSIPDAVIITKIAERRARNPEFEFMQYKMNQNLERRMEAQRLELEQLWDRRQAAIAAETTQPPAPVGGSGGEPQPAPAATVVGAEDGASAA